MARLKANNIRCSAKLQAAHTVIVCETVQRFMLDDEASSLAGCLDQTAGRSPWPESC